MDGNKKIELPDLEAEGMREIHSRLKAFGLNEGEFTFSLAIGGVLVYDMNAGFIWFPMIVMEALGTSVVESQIPESIGNYIGTLGGKYGGGVAGGALTGFVASSALLMLSKTLRVTVKKALGGAVGVAKGAATTLGFSGGFLAVSVLGGAFLGGLVGVKAVRRLGFRDPPQELTPYPKNTIHHIEILEPSILAKTLDASGKAKDKLFSFMKDDIEDRDSLVLCIVTRFKPQTGELGALVDRIKNEAKEREKNRPALLRPLSRLWGSSQGLLGNARVQYFYLSKYVDAIRFKNPEALRPLINTIKAQGVPLVEKFSGDLYFRE